jgi:hypothetical protein
MVVSSFTTSWPAWLSRVDVSFLVLTLASASRGCPCSNRSPHGYRVENNDPGRAAPDLPRSSLSDPEPSPAVVLAVSHEGSRTGWLREPIPHRLVLQPISTAGASLPWLRASRHSCVRARATVRRRHMGSPSRRPRRSRAGMSPPGRDPADRARPAPSAPTAVRGVPLLARGLTALRCCTNWPDNTSGPSPPRWRCRRVAGRPGTPAPRRAASRPWWRHPA